MTLGFCYLIFTLVITIVFSFVPEKFLKPAATGFHKTYLNKLIILQACLVTILFLAVSLIVQRLVFSSLAVSIFLIILSGVSNAKNQALREPLVFSDIAMFSQAFKHPRLYFPFLGLLPVVIMPLLIIGLITALLIIEPALAFTWQRILLSLVAIYVLFIVAKKLASELKLSEKPAIDNQQYGLLNSLFAYAIQASSEKHKEYIRGALSDSPFLLPKEANEPPPHLLPFSPKKPLNNITVIQSESFFDARRLSDSINPEILKNYDACLKESFQFGKLDVPAWGANTMRTEFSFLTGLKYEDMGLYRYYPYQYLHKMPVVSLAKLLQSQGYHCVCIHPHPASFFGRDRIFPEMGFDEFIDIDSFDSKQTFGPYISDKAVTNKILEVNKKYSDKPLFIFAITMENHGPLHLEKTTLDEQKQFYSKSLMDDINDLTVYLRHLKNANDMVQELRSAYKESAKTTTLCFYGDHIPSMPKVYEHLYYKDRDSDYFIWNNIDVDKKPVNYTKNKSVDIKVDGLAELLLKHTGNIKTN